MTQKNLIWLASYPKSGNTWLRVFFANYLFNRTEPFPINDLWKMSHGDGMGRYYAQIAGRSHEELTEPEVIRLRPKMLQGIAGNGADMNFVKTHNQQVKMDGINLMPRGLTRSAIYVVRNPLDMVLSYASHYGLTLDDAIEAIAAPYNCSPPHKGSVAQYQGKWSDHVKTWLKTRDFPVHLMRYEDMKADPEACFADVLKFLKVPVDMDRVRRATEFSSFKTLKTLETADGFNERSGNALAFFRKGAVEEWREKLTQTQIDRIRETQESGMKRVGYL